MAPPPKFVTCPPCQRVFPRQTFERHWSQKHQRVLGDIPEEIQALFAPSEDSNQPQAPPPQVPGPTNESVIHVEPFFDDDPSVIEEQEPEVRQEIFPGAGISRLDWMILTIGLPSQSGRHYVHPKLKDREKLHNMFEDNPYYPYANRKQYKLAEAFTKPRVVSRGLIENACTVKVEFLSEDVAFKSVDDFLERLTEMTRPYVKWIESEVRPTGGNTVYPWAMPRYYRKDSLAALQEILENPGLDGKCKWAPIKEFNEDNERIFTDMHTSDWWWEMQVRSTVSHANSREKLVLAEVVEQ